MEEDLVIGTTPLVPLVTLEALESLELFGDLSVLELVFLRRNSLKKGIVACRSLVCIIERRRVSLIASQKGAHSWRRVCCGIAEHRGNFTTGAHAERCEALSETSDLRVATKEEIEACSNDRKA